jgi:5-formyltetrahydrofolate cyclo-ligase
MGKGRGGFMSASEGSEHAQADRAAIMVWRRAKRTELLAARTGLSLEAHREKSEAVLEHLGSGFPAIRRGLVGIYWPYRREISLFPLVDRIIAEGGAVALPTVVEKNHPVEFRAWRPGDALARGVYDIPFPSEGTVVAPGALIVALVGFDGAGYRLGYGGGYYDRTLAASAPRPLTIGVGFDLMGLQSIRPLPHDIPMDVIVTESGVLQRGTDGLQPETLESRQFQPIDGLRRV